MNTNNTPQVDIILLNWKGAPRTLNLINNLNRLSTPFRLIVVDNDSQDGSLEAFKKTRPAQKVIQSHSNLGFSGGCNLGINWALANQPADYILLLNNDMEVAEDFLDKMLEKAHETKAAIIGATIKSLHQPQKTLAIGGGVIHFQLGTSRHITAGKPDYITGACMLIDTQLLKKVGVLPEKHYFMYWEDADFCFAAKNLGFKLAVADQAIVYHEESASLGKQNPLLAYYFNCSATVFFRKYAKKPFIPIMVGVGGRAFKQLLRRNFPAVKACLAGLSQGLKIQIQKE